MSQRTFLKKSTKVPKPYAKAQANKDAIVKGEKSLKEEECDTFPSEIMCRGNKYIRVKWRYFEKLEKGDCLMTLLYNNMADDSFNADTDGWFIIGLQFLEIVDLETPSISGYYTESKRPSDESKLPIENKISSYIYCYKSYAAIGSGADPIYAPYNCKLFGL